MIALALLNIEVIDNSCVKRFLIEARLIFKSDSKVRTKSWHFVEMHARFSHNFLHKYCSWQYFRRFFGYLLKCSTFFLNRRHLFTSWFNRCDLNVSENIEC